VHKHRITGPPGRWLAVGLAAGIGLLGSAAGATAANDFDKAEPLTLAQADQPAAHESTETTMTRTQVEKTEPAGKPGLPISLGVSYYLMTDYMWRGVNWSEYDGEGREKLNHQMTTSIDWDTGTWGTFGFDTFWEWYADQEKLNPHAAGSNLQEIDYGIRWTYGIEPIATDLTLGYTFYTYPKLQKLLRQDGARGNNNDDKTHEWYFKLEHNDAWMWKWAFPENEDGVLNPYFLFAQDVGIGSGAVWMEFGISHDFAVPGVENLTITPSYIMGIDGGVLKRYLGRNNANHLQAAYQQIGLAVSYDLTPLLHLPTWAGSISISGMLYFSDALGNLEDEDVTQDNLYGGMSVSWSWGG